jgi:Tol biopolymer transport system component
MLLGGLLILQTVLLAILRSDTAFSPWLIYIGRSPSGRAYLYRVSVNGQQHIQLTDVNSINSTPSLSPDGSQLTYVIRDTVNHRGLWVMDMASGQRQRFDTNGMSLDVSWSTDGQWLAYQTWANGYFIYKMRPDGSENQAILPDGIESEVPIWSPDGTSLAFYSCYLGCNLHRLQLNDATVSRISNEFFVIFEDDDIEWSPDGQFLYVVMSREIWRVSVETGQGEMIGRGQNISMSPDGEWVVYEDRRNEQIFIMKTRTDGTGEAIELTEGWNPEWSPDGAWIVFGSQYHDNLALLLMRPDGSQIHHLTDTRERFPDPQWSPPLPHGWNGWILLVMGIFLAIGPPVLSSFLNRSTDRNYDAAVGGSTNVVLHS